MIILLCLNYFRIDLIEYSCRKSFVRLYQFLFNYRLSKRMARYYITNSKTDMAKKYVILDLILKKQMKQEIIF